MVFLEVEKIWELSSWILSSMGKKKVIGAKLVLWRHYYHLLH
jgi:hypothetical protein